jgi:hypothetical protein
MTLIALIKQFLGKQGMNECCGGGTVERDRRLGGKVAVSGKIAAGGYVL